MQDKFVCTFEDNCLMPCEYQALDCINCEYYSLEEEEEDEE